MHVRIGCCDVPKGLKLYFSQFKFIELKQTFYSLSSQPLIFQWQQRIQLISCNIIPGNLHYIQQY